MQWTIPWLMGIIILTAPAAAGEPGFTVPDAAPVLGAGGDLSAATVDGVNATGGAVGANATSAAASIGAERVPVDEANASIAAGAAVANDTTVAARGFTVLLVNWTADEAVHKLNETQRTLSAGGNTSASGVAFAAAVAFAVAETACSRPLVDTTDPGAPTCDKASLVGFLLGMVPDASP